MRIELPRKGTLTLAEVQVFSGGRNVAPAGKASQKNTASGGDAGRGIDNNTSGNFGAGGQTHSEENTANPWWEVDLGTEIPIEKIVVYNRTDDSLGKRLDGFTLLVLDRDRQRGVSPRKIAAPAASESFSVSDGDPAGAVRRAAMLALTYVRGKEAETFRTLAPLVRDDENRAAAIAGSSDHRRAEWPKEQAPGLLEAVVAHLAALPPASGQRRGAGRDGIRARAGHAAAE